MKTLQVSGLVLTLAFIVTWVVCTVLGHYTVLGKGGMAFIYAVVLGCILAVRGIWTWRKKSSRH
jgi:uncharacterized membrane protein